jgi:heptosyltransferase-3
MKILLILSRSYGDCIVALKLIEYLSSVEHIQIDIFTKPQFEVFFKNSEYINNLFLSEHFPICAGKKAKYNIVSHVKLLMRIRFIKKNNYDIALNNIGDFREDIVGWLIGARQNVSVHFNKQHPFINLIKTGFGFLVDKYINIPNNIINIYDMQKCIAENILQKNIILEKKPETDIRTKTAIHPTASMKCRFWEYKNWIELVEKIYKNDKILIFCAPNEKIEVKAAFIAVADKIEIVAEEIQVFLKKLEEVRVFIGLDSFSIHAAYYKNVPHKIMLNGANDAKIWAPPNTKIVEVKCKCNYRPCYNNPKCKGKSFEYACMKSIKVQDVLKVINNE